VISWVVAQEKALETTILSSVFVLSGTGSDSLLLQDDSKNIGIKSRTTNPLKMLREKFGFLTILSGICIN
jgi:hypothetical protein